MLFFVVGHFIRSIEELGREDAVNSLLCGCSLYRIITLEESMGSELSNNSHPTNADNTEESKSELAEHEKIDNQSAKIGEELFHHELEKTPSTLENNDSLRKTLYPPQNINSAVKTNAQLGNSTSDGDGNLQISMSVSGQARVNSNVSR